MALNNPKNKQKQKQKKKKMDKWATRHKNTQYTPRSEWKQILK